MIKYLLFFYAIVSIVTFFAYGLDKRKAKKKRWRTPEAVLLCLGFFGGAVGALIGMSLFRHKTRHWYFRAVNLIGLVWQVGLVVWLL